MNKHEEHGWRDEYEWDYQRRDWLAWQTCRDDVAKHVGLSKLSKDDAPKKDQSVDLIASFGPAAGSFFADAYRLGRYR